MFFTSAQFHEFDSFKEAAAYWDLDFNLLSKNGFNAHLTLYSNAHIQIGRTSLNGKVDQNGLCPPGFRSFVVPLSFGNNFIWLNKKIEDHPLLVFPKNGTLDSVSSFGFDVYVISIEEQHLNLLIEERGYLNLPRTLSSGDELKLHLDAKFKERFHLLADQFLSYIKSGRINGKSVENQLAHSVADLLLDYLERSNVMVISRVQRKRDLALKKASAYIQEHVFDHVTISELCSVSGVSERTLVYAFRETYQVSPKEYIQSLKLNKVRSDLIKGEDDMISTIAAKYGFWHMGQFAADYKKWFGELPSHTRKKS
jgi:AraC-like DNA-binding protein